MSATQAASGRTALEELNSTGEFKRKESVFRDWTKPGSRFPPEAGRYHLYVAYACPWASRCIAVYYLKGLEDVIGLSVTHPTWQRTKPNDPEDKHAGWTFAKPGDPPFANPIGHGSLPCDDGCIPDTVNHSKNVRELYEKAEDTNGKYTVPILWDKKEGTIVNNESSEIMRMFNSEFNSFAQKPDLDLYPEELRKQIEEVNTWVYPGINNGVYRAGFATKQPAYEEAFKEVFTALDRCEDILAKQRYIAGDRLTEADIRLFVTLIRFDHVYQCYFKCNKKFIHQYHFLPNYIKDIFQTPGIAKSVNLPHIKMHYYTSHPNLNTYAVVPVGPDEWWHGPHDRDHFGRHYDV